MPFRARVVIECAIALVALGPLGGCSCADSHVLADAGMDAALVDTGLDSALPDASTDATVDGDPIDAGDAPSDAFLGHDGGLCAPVMELAAPCGVCDGMGRSACARWAQAAIGGPTDAGGWTAVAQCTAVTATPNPDYPCCARASDCVVSADGGVLCTCGAEPACGPGEACVSRFPGDPPACRCIADAP